jgi:hypothetical protein
MTQSEKKTFPGAGKFDPVRSTYRQEIYFKNGRPPICGYSKGLYYEEPEDKIVCLEKFIQRMYNNDYFNPNRIIKIEYYRQSTLLKSRELVLTCYPDRYEFGENAMYLTNERLNKFLIELYKFIKEGKPIDKIITSKPLVTKDEDVFNLRTMWLKTDDQLHEYIVLLSKRGYPPGQIQDFYIKYRRKFFNS